MGEEKKYKIRSFNIFGKDIKCDIEDIKLDENSHKLHIPSTEIESSPVHKLLKVNTQSQDVKKQLFVDESDESGDEWTENDQCGPQQVTVDNDELVQVVKRLHIRYGLSKI